MTNVLLQYPVAMSNMFAIHHVASIVSSGGAMRSRPVAPLCKHSGEVWLCLGMAFQKLANTLASIDLVIPSPMLVEPR